MVARRYHRCLNYSGNYIALESRRTTATMAGPSYSIGLDAFVSVDTAVAALFLTAEVESPATCVWGDCSRFCSFRLALFRVKGFSGDLVPLPGMALGWEVLLSL